MISLKYPKIQKQNSNDIIVLHFLELLHKKNAKLLQINEFTTKHQMFRVTNFN